MNYNKAIIAGHVTRDPEVKKTTGGTSVTKFSVATNSYYTKDGEKTETVEYHNIVVFGRTAENCGRYLNKGSVVLVEGRISTSFYEKEGVKHYKTEIIADNVNFGSKQEPRTEAPKATPATPDDEIKVEDIPF